MNYKTHFVVPGILHQVKSVPCFLIQVHILPFVTLCANLCCHLDEASLVCEYCRDPVPDGTAVAVSCSKSQ